MLLRQYKLLDGTVWFCILLLFYKVLDWALKTRVGGSIILVINSKSPVESWRDEIALAEAKI